MAFGFHNNATIPDSSSEHQAPLAEPDWQELKSILLLHLKHDSSTCTTDGNLASMMLQYIQSQKYSELYTEVVEFFRCYLEEISKQLHDHLKMGSFQEACLSVKLFHTQLKNFCHFLQVISPAFHSLNQLFVKPTFHITLEEKLLNTFKCVIVERHANTLINAMKTVREVPFSVSPSVIAEIANALYAMRPCLREQYEDFFCAFIPNASKSLKIGDLEKEKADIQLMQINIRNQIGDFRTTSVKRSNDEVQREDEGCSHSMLSSLLMGFGT